jgi:hypothetical protein
MHRGFPDVYFVHSILYRKYYLPLYCNNPAEADPLCCTIYCCPVVAGINIRSVHYLYRLQPLCKAMIPQVCTSCSNVPLGSDMTLPAAQLFH